MVSKPLDSGPVGDMTEVSALVRLRGIGVVAFALAALALFAIPASAMAVPGTYTATALVSNNGAPGTTTDERLVNAWGLVAGPATPWWVSDNGADFSTLYLASGVKRIFVTFAKQGPGAKDDLHGQGLGFVDAFDTDGNLLVRVAQHGQLNAPWGLALARASFGRFGEDLLVGSFGDGHVSAYRETPDGTFELSGALRTADGRKLVTDGLWALQFGHGTANNGPIDTLFFTAGPNDESDGLFGTITAA